MIPFNHSTHFESLKIVSFVFLLVKVGKTVVVALILTLVEISPSFPPQLECAK
jgi:hypothetical protein